MPMSFLPLESLDGKWDKSIEKLSILNLSFPHKIRQNISVLWHLASLQFLNEIGGGQEISRVILPAVAKTGTYPVAQ